MGILDVLVAAAGGFGVIQCKALSQPWIEAPGTECDETGRPTGDGTPLPFSLVAIVMSLVAGMMRHVIAQAGIDTRLKALITGGGIGLVMIGPWILNTNAYPGCAVKRRPIDGGQATIGCAIIGVGLVLF